MKDKNPTISTLLAPGQVLGGVYRIVRVIAHTESGAVYEALQTRLNRPVAVKTLNERLANDERAHAQLTKEAERISQLHHPHIVEVLDLDHVGQGTPYLVMELLQGQTLNHRLEAGEPLGVAEALRIGVQIASALTAVHVTGLGHGAVRPSAVFLTETSESPFAKLLNFGISHQSTTSQSGARILDLNRLRGGGHDSYTVAKYSGARSFDEIKSDDQYYLAMVLYEMLTGRTPEPRRSITLFKKSDKSNISPASQFRSGIPAAVDRVLLRALNPVRAARYPEMQAFSSDLLGAGRGLLRSQRPPLQQSDFSKLRRPSTPAGPISQDMGGHSRRTVSSVPHPRERITPSRAAITPGAVGPVVPSRSSARPSSDPFERMLAQVRKGAPNEAVSAALSLLRHSEQTTSARVERRVADHQEKILEVLVDYLGGEDAVGELVRYPRAGESVSSEAVFLLSRLEGGAPFGEVVLLSPLPLLESWALLVELKRMGLVSQRS